MPCARAISSAPASRRSETRRTTSAGMRPAAAAAAMLSKFDPRPDASTPTRTRARSGIADASRPGLDLAHLEHRLARPAQEGARAVGVLRAHHDQIAHAHVE